MRIGLISNLSWLRIISLSLSLSLYIYIYIIYIYIYIYIYLCVSLSLDQYTYIGIFKKKLYRMGSMLLFDSRCKNEVSSSLQDSSQYSDRSQQCCSLDGSHSLLLLLLLLLILLLLLLLFTLFEFFHISAC